MIYRNNLDGLRGIAVLAVLLFHVGFSFISGGYLGVDIFFVLSGYLITSIIINAIDNQKFSYFDFIIRRAKRLLPALYVCVSVTVLFLMLCYGVIDDKLMNDIIVSAKKAVGFTSNNFFAVDEYFGVESTYRPFLHTWSLSVEWQFYIIFPLVLFVIHNEYKHKPKFIAYGLIAVIIALLYFNITYRTTGKYSFAFYNTGIRMWELLLGSLLAYIHVLKIKIKPLDYINNKSYYFYSIIIILMVLPLFISVDKKSMQGAILSILPALGTFIFIYNTNQIKLFGNKYLVYMGQISYSLYLWHWVVIVSYVLLWSDKPLAESALWIKLSLIAVSMFFALLSYYAVEKPFRKIAIFNKKSIFILSLIVLLIPAAVIEKSWRKNKNTFIQNYPNIMQGRTNIVTFKKRLQEGLMGHNYSINTGLCIHPTPVKFKYFQQSVCNYDFNPNSKDVDLLVMGDSHATVQSKIFYELAKEKKLNIWMLSRSAVTFSVPNSTSNAFFTRKGWTCNKECKTYKKYIYANLKNHTIKKVLLVYWQEVMLGYNYATGDYNQDKARLMAQGLKEVIAVFPKETEKYLLYTTPQNKKFNHRQIQDVSKRYFDSITLPKSLMEKMYNSLDAIFKKYNIVFTDKLNPLPLLCGKTFCPFVDDNINPLYLDHTHIHYNGLKKLAPLYNKILSNK